jgi:hypothetical protein
MNMERILWTGLSAKTFSTTLVPEPATVLQIGTGLIGLGVFRRRLRKS